MPLRAHPKPCHTDSRRSRHVLEMRWILRRTGHRDDGDAHPRIRVERGVGRERTTVDVLDRIARELRPPRARRHRHGVRRGARVDQRGGRRGARLRRPTVRRRVEGDGGRAGAGRRTAPPVTAVQRLAGLLRRATTCGRLRPDPAATRDVLRLSPGHVPASRSRLMREGAMRESSGPVRSNVP